ncbi:(2Fe-2S)-binding protein [Modicisalibacter radicis]|uniref:(2Fe-2S)-binding protein n=1 Tax=Halomonas sp. EAR18 TaxID=2518972 RepID=UPI00144480A5|nr:(2Fe-2S)-binding protein [Halomonas sp. EAR18]
MAERRHTDIAVIGAGPAGMAAALTLSEAGLRPVVFDMNATPGGQIYRQLAAPQVDATLMGQEYIAGRSLVDAFVTADIDYRPLSRVWWLDRDGEGYVLGVLQQGHSQQWHADRLILASGAMERGWPFPGWQLPGVMYAGAAQILLKQAALLPSAAPILAGSGPLLYLLAWQYLQAGRPPALVLDMAPASRYRTLMRHPVRAWHGRSYLLKGMRLIADLRRAGVAIRQGVSGLRASGSDALERIHYRHAGTWRSLPGTLLLTHFGVVPEPQLMRSLQLRQHWQHEQQCFVPDRDATLSAGTNLWIAGDGGGIGGARNAEREGHLAGFAAIASLGRQPTKRRSATTRRLLAARRRDLAARPLLDALFRVPEGWLAEQPPETLVCRCEAVTRGELDEAIAQGGSGPNQLKAFTRCGMGPCQGRQCGESVTRLLASRTRRSPDDIGYYHIRPPVHSITLGELAADDFDNTNN